MPLSKTYGRTFRKRKIKRSELKPASKLEENLFMLTKWMGENGFKQIKKMKPKIFDDSGRGLMAEEAIKPGDIIIAVPQNLLITPSSVLDSYLGELFSRYYPKATGHEILSVFLMCEHLKGKSSEWYPYLSSLPQDYSIPLYFCDHSMNILPKPLRTEARNQQDSVKKSFKQLEPVFTALQTEHLAFKDLLTFKLFTWAWSSVNTRSVFMKCLKNCLGSECSYHLALAPFLDLLNHNVDVQVDAGFNVETNCYEITSLSNFKKYSQVFINYGAHENHKLFIEYGFFTNKNYNDHIKFSIDDILLAYKLCNFSDKGLDPKLKFIKENNLLRNTICSWDGTSWNLNIIIKILISEYNIRLWNSFIHKVYNEEMEDSKFHAFKDTLINLKIKEYKVNETHLNCSNCSNHKKLILNLCNNVNNILIKALS